MVGETLVWFLACPNSVTGCSTWSHEPTFTAISLLRNLAREAETITYPLLTEPIWHNSSYSYLISKSPLIKKLQVKTNIIRHWKTVRARLSSHLINMDWLMSGERSTLLRVHDTWYRDVLNSRNEGTAGKRALFHLTTIKSRTKPIFGLTPCHKDGIAACPSGS